MVTYIIKKRSPDNETGVLNHGILPKCHTHVLLSHMS